MTKSTHTLVFAFVLALMLGGCSSTPGTNQKTSQNIMAAAQSLDDGRAQLDKVTNSLNAMVTSPGANLVPQFKEFNTNLNRLDSAARDVQARAERMKAAGQTYFKEWDAEIATINNEDIRNRSTERRAAVEASFARIREQYQALGEAYKPLMSDLQDIRTALNTDLTAGGIDAVRPIADRVTGEAAAVKEAIAKLSSEFRNLGVQMSASGK